MARDVVIDASVASKWILPEPDSNAALAILHEDDVTFHAPELCLAEVLNVLWKRVRRGQLTNDEALAAHDLALELPVRQHAHQPIVTSAFAIALQYEITVYDALYVALARSLGTELITADAG